MRPGCEQVDTAGEDASTDPGSPHGPGDAVQLWTITGPDGASNQQWIMDFIV